jgi:hypothetical protein
MNSYLNIKNKNINKDLIKLVERILSDCKLDVDKIKESDPEFVEYIAREILEWHNKIS